MRCDVCRAFLATVLSQRAQFPLLRPARPGLVMRDVLARAGGCAAVHDAPAGAAVLQSCRTEKGSRKRLMCKLRICIAGPTDGKCHSVRCVPSSFLPYPIFPFMSPLLPLNDVATAKAVSEREGANVCQAAATETRKGRGRVKDERRTLLAIPDVVLSYTF